MTRTIVTVKRAGSTEAHDIELDREVPADQITRLLALGLGWNSDPLGREVVYDIEARPPGYRLRLDETLDEAGVWDGAYLIFHPRPLPHDRNGDA